MQRADYTIYQKITERPEWKKAETVCLYFSLVREVDTKPLLAAALSEEKTVAFPRIEHDNLILYRVVSIRDFERGKYTILEPKKSLPVIDPAHVDVFIVPGVVFDIECNRIGRGKGYYDRLLEGIDVPIIGLAYQYQIVAKIPAASYDVRMKLVITEKKTYAS